MRGRATGDKRPNLNMRQMSHALAHELRTHFYTDIKQPFRKAGNAGFPVQPFT